MISVLPSLGSATGELVKAMSCSIHLENVFRTGDVKKTSHSYNYTDMIL
jgi:hypothetical protein